MPASPCPRPTRTACSGMQVEHAPVHQTVVYDRVRLSERPHPPPASVKSAAPARPRTDQSYRFCHVFLLRLSPQAFRASDAAEPTRPVSGAPCQLSPLHHGSAHPQLTYSPRRRSIRRFRATAYAAAGAKQPPPSARMNARSARAQTRVVRVIEQAAPPRGNSPSRGPARQGCPARPPGSISSGEKYRADAVFQSQTVQSGRREHQCAVFAAVEPAKPGLHVSAHRFYLDTRETAVASCTRRRADAAADRLCPCPSCRPPAARAHLSRPPASGIRDKRQTPSGCSIGTSFRLCTVRSTSPLRRARGRAP